MSELKIERDESGGHGHIKAKRGAPKFIERTRNGPTASRSKATGVNCLAFPHLRLITALSGADGSSAVSAPFCRHARQNNRSLEWKRRMKDRMLEANLS